MFLRFNPHDAVGRGFAFGLAFAAAGIMLISDSQAAPAGSGDRPAARPPIPARTTPAARAKDPSRPTAAPPRGKSTPRAVPPRQKTRPVAPPPKKRARPAPPRRDLRPRLPERPRPDGTSPDQGLPDNEREPVEKTMRPLQGAAWALVGVATALLTFTGVFALMVEDREDEMERLASFVDPYSNPPFQPLTYDGRTKRDFEQYKKEGERYEIVAFTFLGLSTAAVIAATTLFLIDHITKKKKAKESSLRVRPIIGPRGGGVSLGLEF